MYSSAQKIGNEVHMSLHSPTFHIIFCILTHILRVSIACYSSNSLVLFVKLESLWPF